MHTYARNNDLPALAFDSTSANSLDISTKVAFITLLIKFAPCDSQHEPYLEERVAILMRRIWTEITTAGAVEAMEAIMMDLEDLMAEEVSTQSSLWVHSSQSQILAKPFPGPVTDYTSSMVQWMRHRQPRYKGGARIDIERPSASYIVDVCDPCGHRYRTRLLMVDRCGRCYRPRQSPLMRLKQYLPNTSTPPSISSSTQST